VDYQDLGYALTQVAHNLGAVGVVAAAAVASYPALAPRELHRRLAWLALAGWTVQGASGATFGAISYANYGRLPDIHGIAVAALLLKMACAAVGFSLAGLLLARGSGWSDAARQRCSRSLLALALTALTAAAFLRWFS
jgi:hypothetical protein